jgi:hypothetical protein
MPPPHRHLLAGKALPRGARRGRLNAQGGPGGLTGNLTRIVDEHDKVGIVVLTLATPDEERGAASAGVRRSTRVRLDSSRGPCAGLEPEAPENIYIGAIGRVRKGFKAVPLRRHPRDRKRLAVLSQDAGSHLQRLCSPWRSRSLATVPRARVPNRSSGTGTACIIGVCCKPLSFNGFLPPRLK